MGDRDRDPNLVEDDCIYLRPGPAGAWWLSPDIRLNGGTNVALSPASNRLEIAANADECGSDDDKLWIEVWIALPSTTLPPPSANTGLPNSPVKRIARVERTRGQLPRWVYDASWSFQLAPAGALSQGGHQCLIARVWPRSVTNNADSGYWHVSNGVDGDRHVAQRNICVVTCQSPCEDLRVQAANSDPENWTTVQLFVQMMREPDHELIEAVRPAIPYREVHPGVEGDPGFDLYFEDFPDVSWEETDFGRLYTFELPPAGQLGSITTFRFIAHTDDVEPGAFHIFNIRHVEDEREMGGITIVTVHPHEGDERIEPVSDDPS